MLICCKSSEDTTESDLQGLFGKYGEILKIKLLKDHVSRPYAFVQFSEADDASDAIEQTKGITVNDRRLRVERARVNRTLFIAKISRQMQDDQLKEIVEEYGEVESVTIIKNHQTNRSKGCGFVKFAFREDAVYALSELKNNIQHKWVVEWATSNNDPESLRVDKNNIFVGGLNPQEITDEKLNERFSAYGEIESLTLVNRENNTDIDQEENNLSSPSPNDPTISRQRNAFAFIRYKDESYSAAAIKEQNGIEWLGKRIRVQYCESKEMKNKRRAKHMKYAQYNMGPYGYPSMLMMYMGDGVDYPNNPYNSFYPVYYNTTAPWMYQQMPPIEGQQMMPMYGQEELTTAYSPMNMGPSFVPILPWLP